MNYFEPDPLKETLDKCYCGKKPQVKRFADNVLIRCRNPNCGIRIKPYKQEWVAMIEWNKLIRSKKGC